MYYSKNTLNTLRNSLKYNKTHHRAGRAGVGAAEERRVAEEGAQPQDADLAEVVHTFGETSYFRAVHNSDGVRTEATSLRV